MELSRLRGARKVHVLAMIGALSVVGACAGSSGPATTEDPGAPTTVPAGTAIDPTAAAPSGAARFPVPIVEGGQIVSEYPGEVTVAYPEALFEPLVEFYESYAMDRGGAGGELSDGGINYQFDDAGATIDLSVTPEPPDVIVFIRVLP